FCGGEVCPICGEIYDIPLLCNSCNTGFHQCCVTNYTINKNIGIPHIFRCPNCDILLQIDQNLIVETSTVDPKIKSVKAFIEMEELKKPAEMNGINKSQSTGSYGLGKLEDEKEYPIEQQISEEMPKKVRIGGFFGKVYTVKKVGDKIVYEKTTRDSSIKKTNMHSNGEQKDPIFRICPVCGIQTTSSEQTKCQNCGSRL
ncbi:MAG: hypothetical protein ACFFA6_15555, partial [Promethearchaeota archaeon]